MGRGMETGAGMQGTKPWQAKSPQNRAGNARQNHNAATRNHARNAREHSSTNKRKTMSAKMRRAWRRDIWRRRKPEWSRNRMVGE